MSQLDLFEEEKEAPPSPLPGWRVVTKREFFDAIGQVNCHPFSEDKTKNPYRAEYPYMSHWRTLSDHRGLIGISLSNGISVDDSIYMLPIKEPQP